MAHTQFKGKVAASGNSGALRFENSFFKAHPDFAKGKDLIAEPIGDDVMLVRAVSDNTEVDECDPAMNAFLSFIEKDITANPHLIKPIPQSEMDEIADLVDGVDIGE